MGTFDYRDERTRLIDEAISLRNIYGRAYRECWETCQAVLKAGTKTGSIIYSVGINLIREFPKIEFLQLESDAEAYEHIRAKDVKELNCLNNAITGLRSEASYNLVREAIKDRNRQAAREAAKRKK